MEYRQLGRSGLRVSVIGLGGNTFGRYADEKQTARIVSQALDLGINFVDTANIYNGGASEELLGKALRGRRDEVLIATKAGMTMGSGPNEHGSSRKHVIESCEASLRRLDMDAIDLFQIHRFDPLTPLDETLGALDDLVRDGKVRYIGCSNFTAWQLTWSLWISDTHHFAPFVSVQPHYNMFERTVEAELLPACTAFNIGVIPYFPLASGLLTGKYRRGEPVPAGTRFAGNERLQANLTDEKLDKIARLEAIARDSGKSVGQLAIAWLLAQAQVCTVIAGATRPEQIDENAGAAGWRLDASTLEEIAAVLEP